MAINKAMRLALKALSYGEPNLDQSRRLVNLKTIDPLKPLYQTVDLQVNHEGYRVTVRQYKPRSSRYSEPLPVLLFLHGGGWVTESVETYNRICKNMADKTGHIVLSVDYRLAPEYKFPTALEDCYAVAQEVFCRAEEMGIDQSHITLVGDSAGGNLAAALSLLARDRKQFMPRQQILIYPCTSGMYEEDSPYASVTENGTDYLLTRKDMLAYINLYKRDDADLQNPYLAPVRAKDFSNQPRTLIVTAQYDPLRDEGEDYGRRLREAGNEVEIHRIDDALHGFFALSTRYTHVKKLLSYMNNFLEEGMNDGKA